ncbi:uromodulin-like 1 [Solea senegalensis]|uniref:Uromodulin-like 1 n=2 Tax=Solea senegalensis TaxID=28829 RepID=A0AAV6SHI8_SOLSE|nr:uromodulin-like 1 [Solea senegalensis]
MSWMLSIWTAAALLALCGGQGYSLCASGYHLCLHNETKSVSFLVMQMVSYTEAKPCGGWLPWKTCTVTLYKMIPKTENKTVVMQVAKCCDGYVQVGRYCALPVNRSGEFTAKPGTCPTADGLYPGSEDCEWDMDCPGWQKCCQKLHRSRCTHPESSANDSYIGGYRLNVTVTVKVDYQELMSKDNGLLNHTRLLQAMVTGALQTDDISVYYLSSWPVHPYRTATSLLIGRNSTLSLSDVSSKLHLLLKHIPEVSTVTVEDVDECVESAFPQCSPQADCNNTVGSYQCICRQGYSDVDPSNPGAYCTRDELWTDTETPVTDAPSGNTDYTPASDDSSEFSMTTVQNYPSSVSYDSSHAPLWTSTAPYTSMESPLPTTTCSPPNITSLMSSNVTGTSFDVYWSGQSQTNQTYLVVLSKGSVVTNSWETDETVKALRGLEPGVLYNVTVTPHACGSQGMALAILVKTDCQTLDATARLTNVEFTPELQNTSSEAYINLTTSIEEEIYESLSPEMKAMVDSGLVRIEITNFSRGSVVVNFKFVFSPSQSHNISNVSIALLNSLMNSSKYTVDENNTSINDSDECTSGSHDCSQWANCTNTWGSYTCVCKTGYTDNNPDRPGRVCTSITTPETITPSVTPTISSTVSTLISLMTQSTSDPVLTPTTTTTNPPTTTTANTDTTIITAPITTTAAPVTATTITIPQVITTATPIPTTTDRTITTNPITTTTASLTTTAAPVTITTTPITTTTINAAPVTITTTPITTTTVTVTTNNHHYHQYCPSYVTTIPITTTAINTAPVTITTTPITTTTVNTVPVTVTTTPITTTTINTAPVTITTTTTTTVNTAPVTVTTTPITTTTILYRHHHPNNHHYRHHYPNTATTTPITTTTVNTAPVTVTTTPITATTVPITTSTAPVTTTATPVSTTSVAATTTAAPVTTTTTPITTTTTTTTTLSLTTTSAPPILTSTAMTSITSSPSTNITTITNVRRTTSMSGDISVRCRVADITVTVARDFLQDHKVRESDLYLGLPQCGVNGGNATHAQLTVAWDECDTRLVQNETCYTAYVTLFNTMANDREEAPTVQLELPVMCTYPKGMVISADFGSTGYDMIKDVIVGLGSFQVRVQLMNGTAPLPNNYSLSAEEQVVVEVSLNTSSEQIKVVINKCWATSTPSPADPQGVPFLENGCPLNSFTKVLSNGNSSTSRVSVQIFSIVDLNVIYLHCQVHICVQIGSDTCVPDCQQRTARSSKTVGSSVSTTGPLFKLFQQPFEQEYETAHIIGFACLGVGLSLFFIIAFVCLFYYQRNRIGHYNFNVKPKQETFTYLNFNT